MAELVSTNWLYNNINNKKLVIFDCSWFMPNDNRYPKRDFNHGHIRGAYFFDIEKISVRKEIYLFEYCMSFSNIFLGI